MGQSRPLFVYFCYFLDTISIIQIEKSVNGVLEIRTWGRRMVGKYAIFNRLDDFAFCVWKKSHDQYDQMLKYKVAQMFPKVARKVATAVFTQTLCLSKKLFWKGHPIFGLLLLENLSPTTFKIAQSGHTASDLRNRGWMCGTFAPCGQVTNLCRRQVSPLSPSLQHTVVNLIKHFRGNLNYNNRNRPFLNAIDTWREHFSIWCQVCLSLYLSHVHNLRLSLTPTHTPIHTLSLYNTPDHSLPLTRAFHPFTQLLIMSPS